MDVRLYYCKHCGKVIAIVENSGMPTICCGEAMMELLPGKTDGTLEKHVPVIKRNGNLVTVTVGSVLHPMENDHFIKWIVLQTDKGVQKKKLQPGEKPVAHFMLMDDEVICAAYEYCNLHRLWKTE